MMMKRMLLRSLLIVLGSVVGYMLTLVMFAFQPGLMYMNPTMFIHNISFFSGYFSSFYLSGRQLAMYFICIYAAVTLVMCIVFYDMLTLVMFAFQPGLMYMNPAMFIHNISFFSGYFSSFCLSGRQLALYFICIYAAVSLVMCIVFYGLTFLCFLNILGYWMSIAFFAIFAMVYVPLIKRRTKDDYDR